jgi:hypothetical protein
MCVHRLHVSFPAGANCGVPNPETSEKRERRLLRFLSELAGIARHFGSAVFFLHHDLLITAVFLSGVDITLRKSGRNSSLSCNEM